MYFPVLGDTRAALSAKEVFVIAKEFFASLFGQSFVLAKIIQPEIPDQDAGRSFVILFPAKRPLKIKVRKSHRPLRVPSLRFDECKATKPVVDVKPILDHPKEPVRIPNNYFGESFSLIFSEWHHTPKHRCPCPLLDVFRLRGRGQISSADRYKLEFFKGVVCGSISAQGTFPTGN
jgi:hypothetical protein